MHIAVGHIIIAQPFSNIIYRNTVNTMHAKLHLQRKTFAKTTYIWSFWIWRDFCYHSLETVFLVQSSENHFNVSNLENNNLLAVLWNGCEITGKPLNLSLHCVDDPGSSLQRDESLSELYDSRLIFNVRLCCIPACIKWVKDFIYPYLEVKRQLFTLFWDTYKWL